MFIGEFTYTIDDKKRLAVPAKFRELLGATVVLTRGLDRCLFLYSMAKWQKVAEKISTLPMAQADARGFSRIMLAGAMDMSIDALGRILIPDYLKQYAGLEKKTVVAGLYDRIEIWDEEAWIKEKEKMEKNAGDIAERLKELGV